MSNNQNCGNCDAFGRNRDIQVKLGHPHQGWCRASPPTLVTMVMPGKDGQPLPAYQGVFAPTASDLWCRQWRSKTVTLEAQARPVGVEMPDATNKPAA